MVSLRSEASEIVKSEASTSKTNPRKRLLFSNTPGPKSKVSKSQSDEFSFSHNETEGTALACGQGDTGQLGLGSSVTERKRFQPIKIDHKAVQVVCGGMHSVVLTKRGDVFTFGCNDESALGRPTEEEEENFAAGIVEIPNIAKIVQVSAGDSHSAALDVTGGVFIWGIFRDSQGTLGLSANLMQHCVSPIKLSNVPEMIKITSGYNHLTMLSSQGEVYSVGAAEQGELGRISKYQSVKGGRRGISSVLEPGIVYFQGKHKIQNVWSFGYNSFFLSSKNVLFGCGLNNYGQTGTGARTNNVFIPTKLKSFKDVEIVDICGGDHHTLFLDSKACLYSVGRGDMGRLGLGFEPKDPEYITEPEKVSLENVKHIGAGSCVSFAVNDNGDLFAWGAGTNNQMGFGDDEDRLSPELVTSKQLENKKVIMVSAGGQHSMCLVLDRQPNESSESHLESSSVFKPEAPSITNGSVSLHTEIEPVTNGLGDVLKPECASAIEAKSESLMAESTGMTSTFVEPLSENVSDLSTSSMQGVEPVLNGGEVEMKDETSCEQTDVPTEKS